MINNLLTDFEKKFPVVRLTTGDISSLKAGSDIDYYISDADVALVKGYLFDRGFTLLEHTSNKLKLAIFIDQKLYILDIVLDFSYLTVLFPRVKLGSGFKEKAVSDPLFLDIFQTVFFLKDKPKKIKQISENFNNYKKYFFSNEYVSQIFFKKALTSENLIDVLFKKPVALFLYVKLPDLLYLVFKVKISRFFNFKKGQIVAVVGPDGSGKSTVIEKLNTLPMAVSYYMGDKNYRFQDFYHWLMRRHKYIARTVYLFMFIETWFRYFYLFSLKLQGYIVLTDRYPGMNRSASSVETQKHPYVLLYKYMYPKADKYILITADAEEVYKRKQELTVSEIKIYQNYLKNQLNKMPEAKEIENENIDDCLNKCLLYVYNKISN